MKNAEAMSNVDKALDVVDRGLTEIAFLSDSPDYTGGKAPMPERVHEMLTRAKVSLQDAAKTSDKEMELLGDKLGKASEQLAGTMLSIDAINAGLDTLINAEKQKPEEEADHDVDRHNPEHSDNRADFGSDRSED